MAPVVVQPHRYAAVSGGTFTLYPSAQAGMISTYAASYADSRLAANVNSTVPSGGPEVGQLYTPEDPDPETGGPEAYSCFESFLDFDLSTVVGTISTATLSLGLSSDNSTTDFTVEARTRDWGATLTSADWVDGGSLSGLTLLASLATSGIGATGAYKAFTESGTALRTAVGLGGTLRMVLCSSRMTGNNAPTGPEFVFFEAYNHATLKPKLVVVTT